MSATGTDASFRIPASADEATHAINEALAKAQGEFGPIVKTREGGGGGKRYKFADLADILDAVRPVLAKNGLAVTQPFDYNGHGPVLRSELRHVGGGSIVSLLPFVMPPDPQEFGSLQTYLRRYALQALLGIATEDDDGQRAKDAKKPKPEPKAPAMIDESQRNLIDTKLQALIEHAPQAEGQLSWPAMVREKFQVQSKDELTHDQADLAISWLQGRIDNAEIPFG